MKVWPSGTATKLIKGLPPTPQRSRLKLDKPPAKKGKCTRKLMGLELDFHNRYLMEVRNPKGRLPAVWIVETAYPGFTVRLYDKPYTYLGYGYRKAEILALRLALRGHKRVINH